MSSAIANQSTRLNFDPVLNAIVLVETTYLPILLGFDLSKDQVTKVKDLLLERTLGVADAHQLAQESRLPLTATAQLMKNAEDVIDKQLSALLKPDQYSKVKRMLEDSLDVGRVNANFLPQFSYAGHPLSGTQIFAWAELLNKDAASIDPDAQREVTLASLSKFLTPEQMDVARTLPQL